MKPTPSSTPWTCRCSDLETPTLPDLMPTSQKEDQTICNGAQDQDHFQERCFLLWLIACVNPGCSSDPGIPYCWSIFKCVMIQVSLCFNKRYLSLDSWSSGQKTILRIFQVKNKTFWSTCSWIQEDEEHFWLRINHSPPRGTMILNRLIFKAAHAKDNIYEYVSHI